MLLQCYLGERGATQAALLADRLRPAQPPQEPQQPPAPDPAPPPDTDDAGSNSSSSTTSNTSNTSSTASAPPNQTAHRQPARRPAQTTSATGPNHALASIDGIDLMAALRQKTVFFAAPPPFLRGRIRAALHFSLEQILAAQSDTETTRAWALRLLLPRMLLQRPPGIRTLPKNEWRARITAFEEGNGQTLLQAAANAHPLRAPPVSQSAEEPPERRARRARHLVHQGELSAARQALTAGPTAPGTPATLTQLQDPQRRPQEPYNTPEPQQGEQQPPSPFQLPAAKLLTALRKSRKGAAPGPSGLTADTLRIVLDDETRTAKFVAVSQKLAAGNIPANITRALGFGRMIALQKPSGE